MLTHWNGQRKAKFFGKNKEAYQHAIDGGLATVNPVMNMGRHSSCSESADAHIAPLTAVEVRKLLATCQGHYPLLYPAFLCAARTGRRQGELIGLQWGAIDFHGEFIEVRRSVVRCRVTTTKTQDSAGGYVPAACRDIAFVEGNTRTGGLLNFKAHVGVGIY